MSEPKEPKDLQPRRPNPTEPSTKALSELTTQLLEVALERNAALTRYSELVRSASDLVDSAASANFEEVAATSQRMLVAAINLEVRALVEANDSLTLLLRVLVDRISELERERG